MLSLRALLLCAVLCAAQAGRLSVHLIAIECSTDEEFLEVASQVYEYVHGVKSDASSWKATAQSGSTSLPQAAFKVRGWSRGVVTLALTDPQKDSLLKSYLMKYIISIKPDDAVYSNSGPVMSCPSVQRPAGWHLRRTVTDDVPESFVYNPTWGNDVDVYIVDSGVDCTHEDFDPARCHDGMTVYDGDFTDGLGHGTHVAGIVGGKKSGLAKSANIISVRVLNAAGRGSYTGVIAGITWSANQANSTGRRTVINVSIGGGRFEDLDNAVEAAVAAGITVIVSAGNDFQDACLQSPAATPSAIAVGSIQHLHRGDYRSDFSNYGACVTLFAPGSHVLSTTSVTASGNSNAYRHLSGTSMASPLVAAAVAVYLSEVVVVPTPAEVKQWLLSNAKADLIKGTLPTGSPNLVMHIPCDTTPPPPLPAVYHAHEGNCYESYQEELAGTAVLDFPEGAGNYPTHFTACWRITCDGTITMKWTHFDVEAGYDWLYINMRPFSGGNRPTDESYENEVIIRLTSDDYVPMSGFTVEYACADKSTSAPTLAPNTPAPATLAPPTPAPPTPAPATPAPPTPAPDTPAPDTPAPPTPAPPTPAPDTPAPDTSAPPTPAPATPAPPTPSPDTLAPDTSAPPTPAPPTPSPDTPAPDTLSPPTPAPATPAPPTPSPDTPAPDTPAPPTPAPPTPAPDTPAPDTPAPPTPAPATPAPPTPSPDTLAPDTPAPLTPAPVTPAPPTPAPDTPAPRTPAPDTLAPDTPAPPTPAPATPAPPTSSPDTPAPDTPAPLTPAPDTPAPPTPAPVTPAPDTPAPDTPAPLTPSPVTPAPDTPAPDTPAPPTPAPDTPAPLTPAPVTPAPSTPAPDTPAPPTQAPDTPAPDTPAPVTPAPDTPAPDTPAPDTPAPLTPAPDTPAPPTPAPVTPAPDTPAPDTPAPLTPSPVTPAPDTPAPDTPAPLTPSPVTPAPDTPAPDTPAPPTPAPDTPAPLTPAPVTPAPSTPAPDTPAPPTQAPDTPAPDTPAPVTPAPDTPAPDTPAPPTPAPLTPAPATPAPLTPAPNTPAPPTPAPDTPAPLTPAPDTPAPPTPTPDTPTPPRSNLEIVRAIKDRLFNSGGKLATWVGTDYCSWQGITCDGDSNINTINLNDEPTHTVPFPDVSDMANLVRLFLERSHISGFDGLPPTLHQLEFGWTRINGPLPAAVLNLPHMFTMRGRASGLTGHIPVLSSGLRMVDLSDNQLTGAIHMPLPPYILNFIVRGNQLTGPLPQSDSVLRMVVNNNKLTGSIPMYPNMISGAFHHNQLTGFDPAMTPEAVAIDVSNNNMGGDLPNFAGTSIKSFKGYMNKFTGPFPSPQAGEIMDQLFVNYNNLRGQEPTIAEGRLVARDFRAYGNNWDCETQQIDLNHACMWGACSNVVDAVGNPLTGVIQGDAAKPFFTRMTPSSDTMALRCAPGYTWNAYLVEKGVCRSTGIWFNHQLCLPE